MLDLKALKFKQLEFIFEYSHWSVEIITQHSSRLTIWLCKNHPNNTLTLQPNIKRIRCYRCAFTNITKMFLRPSAAAVTHRKRA